MRRRKISTEQGHSKWETLGGYCLGAEHRAWPIHRVDQHPLKWEAFLICSPDTWTAELAPANGMAGYTQPKSAANLLEELELDNL